MREQDVLIKNGYVVTVDPDSGDLPGADLLIGGGVIKQIGVDLEPSAGVRVIDATDMVVLPGMVDTHRHLWQGAIGGTAGRISIVGYFMGVMARASPSLRARRRLRGEPLGSVAGA